MDKGHLTTDKLLLTMEKKLTAIYSRANKEVSEKMAEYLGGLKDKEKQLQEAIKAAKSPEERAKAEAAYKSFMENATLKNAHYNALAKSMAENLKNVNKTAMAYVNGQLPEVYALNYNAVGGDISGKVKGYSFDLVDAPTVKTLATKDETLLPYKTVDGQKDVRWNTKAVNSEILQGILQGESIPDISKRLTHVTEMNLASAIRNARTSTTSAENRGRMDSFHRAEDMGVRMVKVWMATNDERTREEHLELDGQEREIDEPFENSLGEIMYPGDPDADPANVYNCRCTMVTRVLGFEFNQPEDTEEAAETVAFEDTEKALNYYVDHGEKWADSLTKDEREAVRNYGYNHLSAEGNAYLRGETEKYNDAQLAEIKKQVKNIDSAIEKGTIDENLVLYRGVGSDYLGLDFDNPEKLVGKSFTDGGFLSATGDKEVAEVYGRGVVLEMQVPEGTHAAYVDLVKSTGEELKENFKEDGDAGNIEYLLERGGNLNFTDFTYDANEDGEKYLKMFCQFEPNADALDMMTGKKPEDYTIDEIMKKVENLPNARSYDDEKANLLPLTNKEGEAPASHLYASIPDDEAEKLKVETRVKIDDLYTEQAEIFTSRLEDLAESFDGQIISGVATEDEPVGITVAKYNGELVVVDGNNRTNLAILKGQDKLDVMLIDLDEFRNRNGKKQRKKSK